MKELENNNESFAYVGKEVPFNVPSGYFDELPSRIMDRCVGANATTENEHTSIWQVLRSQLALAAGFIGLAFLAFVGYYYIKPSGNGEVLTNDDYIEIVRKNIYDYDEGLLVKESNVYLNYDSINNELQDDMIQYLLDRNIDYVTLMEEK